MNFFSLVHLMVLLMVPDGFWIGFVVGELTLILRAI
jgi:hypothetical protein